MQQLALLGALVAVLQAVSNSPSWALLLLILFSYRQYSSSHVHACQQHSDGWQPETAAAAVSTTLCLQHIGHVAAGIVSVCAGLL